MASMLSGPIPQHPMYNKNGSRTQSPRMGPRVKPEASDFASHGKNGTVANVFEVTGTSYFNSPRKPSRFSNCFLCGRNFAYFSQWSSCILRVSVGGGGMIFAISGLSWKTYPNTQKINFNSVLSCVGNILFSMHRCEQEFSGIKHSIYGETCRKGIYWSCSRECQANETDSEKMSTEAERRGGLSTCARQGFMEKSEIWGCSF